MAKEKEKRVDIVDGWKGYTHTIPLASGQSYPPPLSAARERHLTNLRLNLSETLKDQREHLFS
jgi:hypothetical protein